MDPALASASEGIAGAFIDSLWLEEGLSRNTLDAYRRDLRLFAEWLAHARSHGLDTVCEDDLLAYSARRKDDRTKKSPARGSHKQALKERREDHQAGRSRAMCDPAYFLVWAAKDTLGRPAFCAACITPTFPSATRSASGRP